MNNKCHRKFRMVALDLDGTLLDSDHDISSTTIAYLRYLHSKKFIIAIATGRSAACAAHVIDKLDLLHYDDDKCGDVSSSTSERAASGFPLVCTNGGCLVLLVVTTSDNTPLCGKLLWCSTLSFSVPYQAAVLVAVCEPERLL